MNTQTIRTIFNLLVLLIFLTGCAGSSAAAPAEVKPVVSPDIKDVVAQFQQEIPQVMLQERIPGLAIAVVDDKGILWEEGFGYTDLDRKIPVTGSTLFSIQSMSKSFTATAAMFAAQEGLVDLDEPITTYLPDFTVHSIFEEHPEQKMTLRMLLSHTAGFPRDAAYGNNQYFPPVFSFEKHIASISDTWLLFPVGTRYSYSSEDIDLAGYILQVRSGMPFIQYVQQKVLEPLGMTNSTLDYQQVRASPTRSFGHSGDPLNFHPPVDLLIIPSGGVWSTAEDMARYLQFHINEGALDGKRMLKEDLAVTMYTPPNPAARDAFYALGVYPDGRNNTRHLQHGGGGFGTTNYMSWYPDLKLGAVVLSNAITPDGYAVSLCENVLDSIISSNIPLYRQRFESATHVSPAYPPDTQGRMLSDTDLRSLVESKSMPADTAPEKAAAQKRRSAYAGTYVLSSRGFPSDTFVITFSNSIIAFTHQGDESKVNESGTLTEVQPGMLVSDTGNMFDLRGPVLLVDNYRVVKATPQTLPFKITIYAISALVFLSTLLIWPVIAIFKHMSERRGQTLAPVAVQKRNPWLVLISVLAALASLVSLFCLAIVALMANLVYFPWPSPWADLLWWQSAIFRLPYAGLGMAVGVILLSALALRRAGGTRYSCGYFLAVGLTLLACNTIILL